MKEWNTGDLCQVEVVPGHWRDAKFIRHTGPGEALFQVQGYASKYKVTRKLVHVKERNA